MNTTDVVLVESIDRVVRSVTNASCWFEPRNLDEIALHVVTERPLGFITFPFNARHQFLIDDVAGTMGRQCEDPAR